MNSRNGATILRYYGQYGRYPVLITIGMASFFLFYTPAGKDEGGFYGLTDAGKYRYRDDHAAFICSTLDGVDWIGRAGAVEAINKILGNGSIFSPELAALPGWDEVIAACCAGLKQHGVRETLLNYFNEKYEIRFD
jgi:hypothetical protein